MILRIDQSNALPVYEQIRSQIKRMVATGKLRPGVRLPTIRQLSADLGLAKGTVSKAYELLESDSIIETKGRKGTFVSRPAERVEPLRVDSQAQLSEAAMSYVVVAHQLGIARAAAEAELRNAWQQLDQSNPTE